MTTFAHPCDRRLWFFPKLHSQRTAVCTTRTAPKLARCVLVCNPYEAPTNTAEPSDAGDRTRLRLAARRRRAMRRASVAAPALRNAWHRRRDAWRHAYRMQAGTYVLHCTSHLRGNAPGGAGAPRLFPGARFAYDTVDPPSNPVAVLGHKTYAYPPESAFVSPQPCAAALSGRLCGAVAVDPAPDPTWSATGPSGQCRHASR